MRISKRQLKRIIREEFHRVMNESSHDMRRGASMPYHEEILSARRGNGAPPVSSNWRAFADAMDIGVLDLDEVAEGLGMRNFDQLDAAISPRGLSDSQASELIEIMYSINGARETDVFDAMDLPYSG